MEFSSLLPGQQLFLAGTRAEAAYCIVMGMLQYVQSPTSSKVLMDTEDTVVAGAWVSEAALWSHWTHVGTLEASRACELLSLRAEVFTETMDHHGFVRHINRDYARIFHSRLQAAKPPGKEWPTDLVVPHTKYDE